MAFQIGTIKFKGFMRRLFRPKPPGPVELARQLRELLVFVDPRSEPRERKRLEKLEDLSKRILEIRTLLYGNMDGSEPNTDACAQFTQEFFKDDTLRTLIVSLPKLDLGFRQDATNVVANLQRQRVNARLIASDFLELNMDLMDILIKGYQNNDIALTYGVIARQCIRHQIVAKYVLESYHMKNFFYYVQDPSYEVASDAIATFKELLTRHKSTAAEFLSQNYDWFFEDFNYRLLLSQNYITKRHATKLLGEILLDRSNSAVMLRYVSSLHNMKVLINLLKDSNKSIKIEAFHVFKLFVANKNKPTEIVNVLVSNKSKLLRLFEDLTLCKENNQFEADKAQVVSEIISLKFRVDPVKTIG